MKKTIIVILVCLLAFATIGCDEGLKIVGLEIEKYPDRIVYYKDVDAKLDLTGGVISYIVKEKSRHVADIVDEVKSKLITVSHNIDFTKPGVYVVEFKRAEVSCTMPIQVVDINQIPTPKK